MSRTPIVPRPNVWTGTGESGALVASERAKETVGTKPATASSLYNRANYNQAHTAASTITRTGALHLESKKSSTGSTEVYEHTVSSESGWGSIPATDANIAAGTTAEFVLGVQNGLNVLYCMRVADVNDPRTPRP